ncbi:hypothetical protein C4D60_Mb06t34200 [Musa balbisiana]|uniref:HTH myb-type domain-containing protein n=1 Tax=Musa balbisiana TaxID=52838 RepID=A0A4S8ISN1_MUSBA|nr:hypothetical protein C4D60_Mb06t34200 [Musa balbisiana]
MGEEAGSDDEFDRLSAADDVSSGGDDDDGRVLEWELGLPSGEELTPLSQPLVPPQLASAFSVKPEPARTALDVHRASQSTIFGLCRVAPSSDASAALRSFSPFPPAAADETVAFEGDDPVVAGESSGKIPLFGPISPCDESPEAEPCTPQPDDSSDDHSARALKRPRLVWTPQLHKRFIDVVAHLGIKNAVPKTIMQLMNVEGLTRENVASHLQKYRLYLKRMQGIPDEGPSPSDHLFTSTPPATQSLHEQHVHTPMRYAMPAMFSMPVFGMAPPHGHGSPITMVPAVHNQGNGAHHACEPQHPYGAFSERHKDFFSGNSFGTIASYPHVTPKNK